MPILNPDTKYISAPRFLKIVSQIYQLALNFKKFQNLTVLTEYEYLYEKKITTDERFYLTRGYY